MRHRVALLLASILVATSIVGLWIGQGDDREDPDPKHSTPPRVDTPREPAPIVTSSTIGSPVTRTDAPTIPLPKRFALIEEYAPDDPTAVDTVEFGECALDLELFDPASNTPVESVVTLWRIGAPASANWSRGDQRIDVRKVGAGGFRFTDLPAGNYRVVLHAQRADISDPERFQVDGPLTRVRLPLVRPSNEMAYVEMFDERGIRLESGARVFVARRVGNPRMPARPWTHYRTKTSADSESGKLITGGGVAASSYFVQLKRCDALGYAIGPFPLDSLESRPRATLTVTCGDRSPCRVEVCGSDLGVARRFVGVAIERNSVIARVVFPADLSETEREDLERKVIQVTSHAIPRSSTLAADAWRDVPIHCLLADPRFVPIERRFTLREGIPQIAVERARK